MTTTTFEIRGRGKKPAHLVPPCGRKRADIIAWLKGFRCGRNYSLVTWNVKLHGSLDMGFDHLREVFMEEWGAHGYTKEPVFSPRWIDQARAVYDRDFGDEEGQESLRGWGREDAWRQFVSDQKGDDNRPGDDGYSTLWNGKELDILYSGAGQSGGFLIIWKFEGYDFSRCDPDTFDELSYSSLLKLAEIVQYVTESLRSHPPEKRVEEQAAWAMVTYVDNEIPSRADLVSEWLSDQSGDH